MDKRAFHFTAEVRVAWGVNDVDVGTFPAHGTVLGQDGDAAFTFDGVVVHHSVDDLFVVSEGAALTQQLVNHGRFAMVNVGDDRNIADLSAHETLFGPKIKKSSSKRRLMTTALRGYL
jgi:hypothetical protein